MEKWPTEREIWLAELWLSTASIMQASMKARLTPETPSSTAFLARYSPLRILLDDGEFAAYEHHGPASSALRDLRRQRYRELLDSFVEEICQARTQKLLAFECGKQWQTFSTCFAKNLRLKLAILQLRAAVHLHAAKLPSSTKLAVYAFGQVSRCFVTPVVPITAASR